MELGPLDAEGVRNRQTEERAGRNVGISGPLGSPCTAPDRPQTHPALTEVETSPFDEVPAQRLEVKFTTATHHQTTHNPANFNRLLDATRRCVRIIAVHNCNFLSDLLAKTLRRENDCFGTETQYPGFQFFK